MDTAQNQKIVSKEKERKCMERTKFIKSEVKGNKFWNYEHRVYKANSKKSNTIDIYG